MKYSFGFFLVSLFTFSKAQILTQWTPFSDCSATCNTGNSIRTRTRSCTPANLCQGISLFDTTSCNVEYSCPDYRLGDWGTWSSCSESCRATQSNPTRVRTRSYCLSNSTSAYQCTSNFMVSYEPCNTVACSTVKSCNHVNFTFVFVLDSSSSVEDQEWMDEKGLVLSFVKSSAFGVNPNVDVAVVNYGSTAQVEADCGTFKSYSTFETFMNNLKMVTGGTAIHRGLTTAETVFQRCQKLNMNPVIVLLTDGFENIDTNIDSNIAIENRIKSEALLVAGAVHEYKKDEIDRITSYIVNGQNVSYNFFATNFTYLRSGFADNLYNFVVGKSQCETQGQWTSWTTWENCSQLCGVTGYMKRSRSCMNPITSKIQEDCELDGNKANLDYMTCIQPCASFSEWSSWGACSASCNLDSVPPKTSRFRSCLPGLGSCIGSLSETQECNTNTPCQGIISSWGAWSQCSATCQLTSTLPTQQRSRTCVGATLGGNCDGQSTVDSQTCSVGIYCPGTISDWSFWGACSSICNNLVNIPFQTRSRSCIGYSTWDPNYTGCPGITKSDQQSCNVNVACSGSYGEWSAWSSCSESCQSNPAATPFQTQTRPCLGATLGGGCAGPSSQTMACNSGVPCPGVLSGWSTWGACSASCQLEYTVPTQTSTRTCSGASLGGNCNGQALTQTKNCNAEVICPGTLSGWGAWSVCSASCNTQVNGPYQYRSQSCIGASTWNPNLVVCGGASLNDQQFCNQNVPCPGFYTAWSAWSSCSESCQSNINNSPTQFHTRTCQNFTLNGGCVGVSSETQNCNSQVSCPGDLTQWSGFSACSQSCQIGSVVPTMNRVRSCLNPTFGGNCQGQSLTDVQPCNAGVACPGQLTDWTSWSQCPATCQQTVGQYNLQYRSRQCVNASLNGNCGGAVLNDQTPCVKDVPCPGILSQWSTWSSCSESCRSNLLIAPSQTRTRTCTTATLGANCGGASLVESLSCNANVGCPGVWTSWGPFTDCSASCQSTGNIVPTQSRQRFCVNNTLDGPCPSDNNGDKIQTVQCNVGVICPVRGTWSTWGAWSTCSASCDAGIIQRSRACSVPYPIGAGDDCTGNTTQTLPCKLFDCPKSCAIAKRCNCSQVKQWSSVPTFDQFQSRGLTHGAIETVLRYLSSYGDDTVDKACQACNTMMLTTLRSNVADQLSQAKAARAKLELIKNDLRDVIYCNGVILNNAGLWSLYDLMFEHATMLDGVIIELNAIYLRFDAALTSCQSYGWIHQTFKTILRKCTF